MHQGATWNDRDDNKNVTPTVVRNEHFTKLVGCFIVEQCDKSLGKLWSVILFSWKPLPHAFTNLKTNKTRLYSLVLHISTVTHSVVLILPLTRVACSIGLQAMLPSRELCVRLPPIRGIMCPSSNASYGPLIKRSLKSGPIWEEETERFCAHRVRT